MWKCLVNMHLIHFTFKFHQLTLNLVQFQRVKSYQFHFILDFAHLVEFHLVDFTCKSSSTVDFMWKSSSMVDFMCKSSSTVDFTC